MNSTIHKTTDFMARISEARSSSSTYASSPSEAFRHPIDYNTSLAMSSGRSTNTGLTRTSSFQDRAFTIFTKLPYELQNMVWTIAAFEPRVVEIQTYSKTKQSGRGRKKTELRFLSRTLVPAMLHTCSGSREMGLKLYERLCFGDYFSGCYINWMCDYISVEGSLHAVLDKADTTLAEMTRKCQRLIIREYEFSLWCRHEKLRNLEEAVLLCKVTEPRGPLTRRNSGNLTLVPINDPRLWASTNYTLQHYRRKEQQFKTLMQVDDLDAFATAISARQLMPGGSTATHFDGQEWFQPWDVVSVVQPFQRVKKGCKRVIVMSAIRGKEEAMTRDRKAERKRREKANAQKEYRLAHPEIPWHEHGFQSDCPCVECAGSGST